MGFNYRVLNLESMTVPTLKLKEIDEAKYNRCNGLRKSIIEIWLNNKERYLLIDGEKYKVKE